MKHQDILAGSIHTPFNWAYADQTSRLAAVGFATGDVGKVALQESDATLWLLTSEAPVWTQVTGKPAINPTGAWSSSTAYNVGDLARNGGDLWLALQSNTNQTPAEDAYWTLFLSDGSGGGMLRSVNSISTNTTAGATASTDYVYFASGTITLTLPTAVSNTNRYTVKNTGSGTITVATTSAQTIDGASTLSIATANESFDVISDGANWRIV